MKLVANKKNDFFSHICDKKEAPNNHKLTSKNNNPVISNVHIWLYL